MFFYTGVWNDFHIRWCSCRLIVIRRISYVEEELLALPERLSSPRFLVEFALLYLILCVMFCLSLWPLHCIVCPPIYVFWLPFDYLLITFWLPSDYLLITFCLPFDYLLVTLWLPSDYLLITFWLSFDYLLITFRLPSDYLFGIFKRFLEYIWLTNAICMEYLQSMYHLNMGNCLFW